MVAKHRIPSGTQAASKSLEQFGPAKMTSAAKSPPKAAFSGNTKIRWTWPFSMGVYKIGSRVGTRDFVDPL